MTNRTHFGTGTSASSRLGRLVLVVLLALGTLAFFPSPRTAKAEPSAVYEALRSVLQGRLDELGDRPVKNLRGELKTYRQAHKLSLKNVKTRLKEMRIGVRLAKLRARKFTAAGGQKSSLLVQESLALTDAWHAMHDALNVLIADRVTELGTRISALPAGRKTDKILALRTEIDDLLNDYSFSRAFTFPEAAQYFDETYRLLEKLEACLQLAERRAAKTNANGNALKCGAPDQARASVKSALAANNRTFEFGGGRSSGKRTEYQLAAGDSDAGDGDRIDVFIQLDRQKKHGFGEGPRSVELFEVTLRLGTTTYTSTEVDIRLDVTDYRSCRTGERVTFRHNVTLTDRAGIQDPISVEIRVEAAIADE